MNKKVFTPELNGPGVQRGSPATACQPASARARERQRSKETVDAQIDGSAALFLPRAHSSLSPLNPRRTAGDGGE